MSPLKRIDPAAIFSAAITAPKHKAWAFAAKFAKDIIPLKTLTKVIYASRRAIIFADLIGKLDLRPATSAGVLDAMHCSDRLMIAAAMAR